ncbi:MAG: tRNA preQ1(34) S-adenosylmethionine ribosyltransferase-isomerase QueA [Candidatus Sulfotelmatobacter sp.]
MLVSEFHYDLPEELIAQQPLPDRASSRLLHLSAQSGAFEDRQFREFTDLLRPSDLVVFNNTRVFPARLYGRRGGLKSQPLSSQNPASRDFLQGRVEVLLTRQLSHDPNDWECLVRPGRKIAVGEHLYFGDHDELRAEVIARGDFGERHIRFIPSPMEGQPPSLACPERPEETRGVEWVQSGEAPQHVADFFATIERIGHIPLPPYIAREDSSADRDRYQTVYARERGSVAAPTAGLHFTPEILARLRERNIETAEVTLHVGLGTFQPIRAEKVEEHKLHSETYSIAPEAADQISRARRENRRVVAIGTTTVRTLEYAAQQGQGTIRAASGEANLFIYPGYKFQLVGALLTNFHLPQSSLLMLVCALGGQENVLAAYRHAVADHYRFYSYGDCMFVE